MKFLRDMGRPYWTDVRGIGNTPAAKATILVPLIGYWIIFNNYLIEGFALWKGLPQDTSNGPSWRLFTTYFGLCFVGFGSMIYQMRCRPEIKLYETASQYMATSSHLSDVEVLRVREAIKNGDERSQQDDEKFIASSIYEMRDGSFRLNPDEVRTILHIHFDFCNRWAPASRLAAYACNIFGLVLLSLGALDVFKRVLCVSAGMIWAHF